MLIAKTWTSQSPNYTASMSKGSSTSSVLFGLIEQAMHTEHSQLEKKIIFFHQRGKVPILIGFENVNRFIWPWLRLQTIMTSHFFPITFWLPFLILLGILHSQACFGNMSLLKNEHRIAGISIDNWNWVGIAGALLYRSVPNQFTHFQFSCMWEVYHVIS
jgi:hypothetical protein